MMVGRKLLCLILKTGNTREALLKLVDVKAKGEMNVSSLRISFTVRKVKLLALAGVDGNSQGIGRSYYGSQAFRSRTYILQRAGI